MDHPALAGAACSSLGSLCCCMLGLGDMLRGERRQGAVYFIAGGLCQLSGCLGVNPIHKILEF